MSYESGSLECRKLVEAKESLIQIMQSLEYLNDADEINIKLKEIEFLESIAKLYQRVIFRKFNDYSEYKGISSKDAE